MLASANPSGDSLAHCSCPTRQIGCPCSLARCELNDRSRHSPADLMMRLTTAPLPSRIPPQNRPGHSTCPASVGASSPSPLFSLDVPKLGRVHHPWQMRQLCRHVATGYKESAHSLSSLHTRIPSKEAKWTARWRAASFVTAFNSGDLAARFTKAANALCVTSDADEPLLMRGHPQPQTP